PEKTASVPPVAWAAGGAAEAEDTFVIAVDPAALLDRLKSLLLRFRRLGLKPWLDCRVLRKDMGLVRHEVLDDPHIGERVNRRWGRYVGDETRAGQPIGAVHRHGAGTTDTFAT